MAAARAQDSDAKIWYSRCSRLGSASSGRSGSWGSVKQPRRMFAQVPFGRNWLVLQGLGSDGADKPERQLCLYLDVQRVGMWLVVAVWRWRKLMMWSWWRWGGMTSNLDCFSSHVISWKQMVFSLSFRLEELRDFALESEFPVSDIRSIQRAYVFLWLLIRTRGSGVPNLREDWFPVSVTCRNYR